jgi:hypothetical protein
LEEMLLQLLLLLLFLLLLLLESSPSNVPNRRQISGEKPAGLPS